MTDRRERKIIELNDAQTSGLIASAAWFNRLDAGGRKSPCLKVLAVTLSGAGPKETQAGPCSVGRAWRASELRNKSWEDLQKLWYVLLKERNLLASQNEEAGRLNISRQFFSNTARVVKCKKSMARIRTVLNERRLAYVQAEREAIRERKQMRTELIRENTLKNLEKKGLETGEVNSPPSGSVSKQVAKETVQAAPTSSPAQPSSSQ
ncbi:54S ribosomal protein L4 mitochondrial [Mycoemilia scoparia]|uniref:Large ribosomal subunit protein uL29m n=1 Tax=Mycoemilia scoparia TaxID=417184 RepID=A0A9W8DU70_9FUNG|nr:54S ribosomal protein L4 mitochondrial [Mycoemilia scoparia]